MTGQYHALQEQVERARQQHQPLVIKGAGTRHFYGRQTAGEVLDTLPYTGIIAYEPTELVITARAGTPLAEIEETLTQQGQSLAFEPPRFGSGSTLGGVVATGLSGPARPHVGSCRDFILGLTCLSGQGQVMTFGGQVMKNVAGYDVSRLMTGALGTLGVLLEISVKVMPRAEYEITVSRPTDFNGAISEMNTLAAKPLPITATCFDGKQLYIRLSGKQAGVEAALANLQQYVPESGVGFWSDLRDHKLPFFDDGKTCLCRLSVPSMTPAIPLEGDWLIEWGGALRWLKTSEPLERVRELTSAAGGHATLFRRLDGMDEIFHPLSAGMLAVHKRLKQVFDPEQILNRGRLYPEF